MVKQSEYYHKPSQGSADELTLKQRKFCRAYLKNGFKQSEAAKTAGYSQPDQAGYITLHKKPVQAYLARHVRQMEKETQIDFQWKVKKLASLVENGIPDEKPIMDPVMAKLALDGISELNKMQGDLAPTKNVNANLNVEMEKEDIEILESLMQEHDKEY